MSALGALAVLAYGLGIGFIIGCGVGWMSRHREDTPSADSLLEVHNDRLRRKNRELHEKCRALEVERRQLCEEREVLLDALCSDDSEDIRLWTRELGESA